VVDGIGEGKQKAASEIQRPKWLAVVDSISERKRKAAPQLMEEKRSRRAFRYGGKTQGGGGAASWHGEGRRK
jgi:hypothetical protein